MSIQPSSCSGRARFVARSALAFLGLLPVASAQSGYFGARGPEFPVNQNLGFNQYWTRVATTPNGSKVAFSFNSGQDVFLRLFDVKGVPLTADLICNPTLNLGNQDEAEVSIEAGGNVLVCWSERHGYDGEMMGIYGRVFNAAGVPLGAEHQINEVGAASQWRPLISPRPSGGWVVAWSSDWDGDAILRVLDGNGAFLTGDVAVNTFDNGAQVDTATAIAPDGTMFVVFVDYSGHASLGSGTNLWGRMFDEDGVPLQTSEFPLTTANYAIADQREPRVSADSAGNFVVVWEDAIKDGANWGIFGRRFDSLGGALGPEFQINTTTVGPQRNARVVSSASGEFVVIWEDWSTGNSDVRAQRFDAAGARLGPEFLVNTSLPGDNRRPSLAMTQDGSDVFFSFEAPGNQTDAFARVFTAYQPPATYCTAKLNSQGCTPAIGYTGSPSLSGPDNLYVVASQVLNQKSGIMFYGFVQDAIPFQGGTLCVQPPTKRTPVQDSFGNPPPDDCSGAYSFFFSHAYAASKSLDAGTIICAQFWSRDPGSAAPNTTGLTNALTFELRP